MRIDPVIKLAASAAFLMPKMQRSAGGQLGIGNGSAGLSLLCVIRKAALTADMIKQVIFEHLEQNPPTCSGALSLCDLPLILSSSCPAES